MRYVKLKLRVFFVQTKEPNCTITLIKHVSIRYWQPSIQKCYYIIVFKKSKPKKPIPIGKVEQKST